MNKRNNDGITLIALVVTIIVLLILAGVTISTLTGDNGLIQKAGESKKTTEKAREEEMVKLAVAAAQIEGNGTLNKTNLDKELEEYFGNGKTSVETDDGWTFEDNEKYKIDNDGNVEKVEEDEEEDSLPSGYKKVEYIESGSGEGVQYIDTGVDSENAKINITCSFTKNTGKSQVMINCDHSTTGWFGLSSGGNVNLDGKILQSAGYDVKSTYSLEYTSTTITGIGFSGTHVNVIRAGQPISFKIFASGLNSSPFNSYAKLYNMEIYQGGTLVRNFLPCKRESDNEVGLYDVVSNTFYANEGSGSFISGAEIN